MPLLADGSNGTIHSKTKERVTASSIKDFGFQCDVRCWVQAERNMPELSDAVCVGEALSWPELH